MSSATDLQSADGGVGALVGMFDGRSNSSPSHPKLPAQVPPPKSSGMLPAGPKQQPVGSKAKPTPPLKPTAVLRDDNTVAKDNTRDVVPSQANCGPTSPPCSKGTVSPAQSRTGSISSNTGSGSNGATPAASTGAAKQKVPLMPPAPKVTKVLGTSNRDSPEPATECRRDSGDSARAAQTASKVAQQLRVDPPGTESTRQVAADRSRQQLPGASAGKASVTVNGGNAKAVGSSNVIPRPKIFGATPPVRSPSIGKHGAVESGGEQTPTAQSSGYEPPFMKLAYAVGAAAPPSPAAEPNAYANVTLKPSHSYVNVLVGPNGFAPLSGKVHMPAAGDAEAVGDDSSEEESVWSGDENAADVVYENCGPDENDRPMTADELECHILAKGREGLGTEYLKLRNDRLSGSYRACRCVDVWGWCVRACVLCVCVCALSVWCICMWLFNEGCVVFM